MKEQNAIFYFNIEDFAIMIKDINNRNNKVYYIDDNVSSIEELFVWIKENLPLDPPLYSSVNFDAFADSLWEGLDNLYYEKVAIVWKYPMKLKENNKEGYYKFLQCLRDVANNLLLERSNVNKPIYLKIYLGIKEKRD